MALKKETVPEQVRTGSRELVATYGWEPVPRHDSGKE